LGQAPITGSHNWDVSIPERGGVNLVSWRVIWIAPGSISWVGLIESTQGGETSDYIYLGKRLLAIRTSSATGATLTYLHHDALNTLVATSRANGEVLTSLLVTIWRGRRGACCEDSGYSGHLADPDTGLVYMGRRYYDPQLARFISPDPLAASTSGGQISIAIGTPATTHSDSLIPRARVTRQPGHICAMAAGSPGQT
jgi:RHS repeat-associated protein